MLSCQKDKFSLPAEAHYLNCAYMSPMLKSAEQAGMEAMALKRDPSRIKSEDFFSTCSELRQEFAHLIGVENSDSIAIIPSVSYGIANAANNIHLSSGDEVVILGEQFPSNVYAWTERAKKTGAKIVTIHSPDNISDRVASWNERIIEAINDKTRRSPWGKFIGPMDHCLT